MDEQTLTDQWDQNNKDPFPIYTVIDKQNKDTADPWFEISPHEAGYSLTGAFVDTSSFGSHFDNGSKKKHQPEMDMLYLQALCGSALAERKEIEKFLWEIIKDLLHLSHKIQAEMFEEMMKDSNSPSVEKCYQFLMDLVDMNLCVLNGEDPSDLEQSIREKLDELDGGRHQLIFPIEKLSLANKQAEKLSMNQHTEDKCNNLSHRFSFWPDLKMCACICECIIYWIWGRNYDFLHNMKDKTVPSALLESETRDYEDAGLMLNSPYFSVLRKERNIHLIISLDFSEGDPFMTVTQTAEMCKKLNIPFPDVPNFPDQEKKEPKDFYVFKGENTPTVIHIPLFNVVNCGDKLETWREEYTTMQFSSYNSEKITKLMEVAGKNISNNIEKLREEIQAVIEQKRHD